MPADIRGCLVVPVVELRSLWFNAGRFGAMWEVSDLRVDKAEVKSPWS